MTDLDESLARLEATREAKRRERALLWEKIKAEEPEMVAVVEALARLADAKIIRYETQEGLLLIDTEAAVEFEQDQHAQAVRFARNMADLAALLAIPEIARRYGR